MLTPITETTTCRLSLAYKKPYKPGSVGNA